MIDNQRNLRVFFKKDNIIFQRMLDVGMQYLVKSNEKGKLERITFHQAQKI